MPVRTVLSETIPEGTTWRYAGTLYDETDTPISHTQLSALTLTLFDKVTGDILNSVNDTSILNVDRGTVSTGGELVVILTPSDNPIHNPSLSVERHVMLFEWTWDGGNRAGKHEVEFAVQNLSKVTT